MTATEFSALAGIVLSLIFSYVPGLNTKFASWSSEIKRVMMLGVMLVTALAIYGVGCLGWFDTGIACTATGALDLLKIFIAAVIANQAVYSISPQPLAVREAKAERIP